MPTFATPEPVTAVVEVVAGAVRLAATDRHDTVVEIGPHDPGQAADVQVAEQARVEFHNGTLTVTAVKKGLSLGRRGAVRVDIALPTGSRLKLTTASADVDADGAYSESRFMSSSGAVRIARVTGNVKVDTASGDVSLGDLVGGARITTASGDVAIDRVEGDVRFQAASGGLAIGMLRGQARVLSASGWVAVGAAVSGGLSAQTGSGEIEVGIPDGTAVRLELRTHSGTVDNALRDADGPDDGDETFTVNARSASGDIAIRRAVGPLFASGPI